MSQHLTLSFRNFTNSPLAFLKIAILCWMTSNTSVCFFTTWHQLSLSCWIIKLCLPFFFFVPIIIFLNFVCLLVTINACNLRIKSVSSLSFQVLQNLCFKNHTMNSWKKHLSQMDYYAAKVLNTYRFFFDIIFRPPYCMLAHMCVIIITSLYNVYQKHLPVVHSKERCFFAFPRFPTGRCSTTEPLRLCGEIHVQM